MITTLVALKMKHGSTVAAVVHELSEHPDLASEEIALKAGVPKDELLDCYDIIQGNEELQRIIIDESTSPRLTGSTSDLLTDYKNYLVRILSGEEVYPLILEFHPGPICQCQCGFCFSKGFDYDEHKRGEKPISLDKVIEVFRECKQNAVEQIWFSGGKEPFMNPLTSDYIRAANQMGFGTRLYTNGVSMSRQVHDNILDCQQIRISINAATPLTYNRIQFPQLTKIQSSKVFDTVLDNVHSLTNLKKEKNKKVKIGINQILQPDNCHEMLQFVSQGLRLGVDSVHFRLDAMDMVRDFSPAEMQKMRSAIAELSRNSHGIEVDIRGVAEGEFESRAKQFLPKLAKARVCRAGLLKRNMNPYGAVYYCEFSSHPRFQAASPHLRMGDIKQESLGDILRRNVHRYPRPCRLCQAHEYGLNITLEKVERDLEYGIPIERQPYYRRYDRRYDAQQKQASAGTRQS